MWTLNNKIARAPHACPGRTPLEIVCPVFVLVSWGGDVLAYPDNASKHVSPCVGLRAQVDNALHPDGLRIPLYPCGVAWLACPMTASFASSGHWSLLCPYYLGIAAPHEVQSVD
jgi:hypothetical protein